MWLNLVAGIPDLAASASMGGLFVSFSRNACEQEATHEPCRHIVLVLVTQDLDPFAFSPINLFYLLIFIK